MTTSAVGEVITFYSYTGGAGRTLAMASVGTLLARRYAEGRVLLIDWNLESPGLHLYFPEAPEDSQGSGLLDLFHHLAKLVADYPDWPPESILEAAKPEAYILDSGTAGLSILKAGRFDEHYFTQVSGFDWEGLDEKAPWLFAALLDYLRSRYRYILIDSRSGVNQMSGLCAMMLPDRLVGLFTLSHGSLRGLAEIARLSLEYRRTGEGRPFVFLPVPARLEMTETDLLDGWRFGAKGTVEGGYQGCFERVLAEGGGPEDCNLHDYFAVTQIPYSPRCAYGEPLAALGTAPIRKALEALALRVASGSPAWEAAADSSQSDLVEVDGALRTLADAEAHYLQAIPKLMAQRNSMALGVAFQKLADLEARSGRTIEARSYYAQALTMFRGLDARAHLADALDEMARLEGGLGNDDEARRQAAEALQLFTAEGNTRRMARAAHLLADIEARTSHHEQARSLYRQAMDLYRRGRENLELAEVFESLGMMDRKLGREQAEGYLQQAVEFYRCERDIAGMARALRRLAEVEQWRDRLEDSWIHYTQAVELVRGDRDRSSLASALQGLADVEKRLGRVETALSHYQHSVDLLRGGLPTVLASALQGLADLESRLGKPLEAKGHYAEAAALFEQAGNAVGLANACRSLGDLERRAGRLEEAREAYRKCMELYRSESNALGQANALQSLGELDHRLGNHESARAHLSQALHLFHVQQADLGVANTLKCLGDLEAEAGSPELARNHYDQAIETYRAIRNQLGLANALQRLGDLERQRSRLTEAAEAYTEARQLYLAEQSRSGLAYTCSELARVSHALCDFTSSLGYLHEAVSASGQCDIPSVRRYVENVRQELVGRVPVSP